MRTGVGGAARTAAAAARLAVRGERPESRPLLGGQADAPASSFSFLPTFVFYLRGGGGGGGGGSLFSSLTSVFFSGLCVSSTVAVVVCGRPTRPAMRQANETGRWPRFEAPSSLLCRRRRKKVG